MTIVENSLVEKAIDLVNIHGNNITIDNLQGEVQEANLSEFKIILVSPFSGAEILPGAKGYILSIWFEGRKVLNMAPISFGDKEYRSAWAKNLMSLT